MNLIYNLINKAYTLPIEISTSPNEVDPTSVSFDGATQYSAECLMGLLGVGTFALFIAGTGIFLTYKTLSEKQKKLDTKGTNFKRRVE